MIGHGDGNHLLSVLGTNPPGQKELLPIYVDPAPEVRLSVVRLLVGEQVALILAIGRFRHGDTLGRNGISEDSKAGNLFVKTSRQDKPLKLSFSRDEVHEPLHPCNLEERQHQFAGR